MCVFKKQNYFGLYSLLSKKMAQSIERNDIYRCFFFAVYKILPSEFMYYNFKAKFNFHTFFFYFFVCFLFFYFSVCFLRSELLFLG